MAKQEVIIQKREETHLNWVGCVIRMDSNRLTRKLLENGRENKKTRRETIETLVEENERDRSEES